MDATELYREAVKCLSVAALECQKIYAWDLQLVLRNCRQCSEIIAVIKDLSTHPLCTSALEQLMITVANHCAVLETKLTRKESEVTKKRRPCNDGTTSNDDDSAVQRRQAAVLSTILASNDDQRRLRFSDVAGLIDAKQALQEAVMFPTLYPQLFTGGRKPWKSVLLFGPPGTGKSRLALALSAEVDSTFYSVSSADLVSHWVGESEKLVKELFEHASAQRSRSVIFIDELDGLCRQRVATEEEYTRRIKTELLKQIEGATESHVFLLCATNCPWELDAAFRRRFQKRIYVPLPDWSARLQLMKIHIEDCDTSLSDEDWNQLADRTEGYSGSDIRSVVLGALYEPIRRMQAAQYWRLNYDSTYSPCDVCDPEAARINISNLPASQVRPLPVGIGDFLRSLSVHGPTVTADELRRFTDFVAACGERQQT